MTLSKENWSLTQAPSLEEHEHLIFMTELHRKIHTVALVTTREIDILDANRFLNFNRMIRSTAYVIKMVHGTDFETLEERTSTKTVY